ncbi:MAG: acyl-CoA dehydrogenase family protein, partial [Bacteroidota bacterium]
MPSTSTLMKGGAFLLQPTASDDIFTSEEFSEEQQMVKDMVMDFINNRIAPNFEQLEKMDNALSKQLLHEMGTLGITGISFPEAYGGSNMDFITHTFLSELMAHARSMSVSFSAHTGIGMLPILYFGTEAQKEQYLPDLVAGTKAAAYCLTEPGSGSDALAAKTSAVLSE